MKHDLRKFVPDVAQILAETTPEKVAARRRKALEQLREEGLIDRLTPAPPGAEDAEPHEVPRTEEKKVARRSSPLAIGIGAAVAVTVPAILVALFMGREADRKIEAAAASARAALVRPGATATPGAGTMPSMTPAASSTMTATAMPSATVTATTVPSATAPLITPPAMPRGAARDPHENPRPAPAPSATAAATATAAPDVGAAPSAEPPAASPGAFGGGKVEF
jgi:hypothetical protein